MRRFAALAVVAFAFAAGEGAHGTPSPPPSSAPPTDLSAGDGPLVVLDPGHGGANAGAPGYRDGLHEKALTLAFARNLAARLERRGYRVVLTRTADVYLSLRERVAFANRAGADLFVSLHLNASPDHAQRGYETFVLTPDALDVDGRALRLGDGAPRPGVDAETAYLLDDVERGLALPDAADLALRIQTGLREVRGPDGDRGVRQDSMHVLLGATMPAVLIEAGFIDHPIDGAELADPAVQDRICQAIADAIVGAP